MARRMIDPQTIIKSQIVNDKMQVDLNEILEKYGTEDEYGGKSVTLQIYSKKTADDGSLQINSDTGHKAYVIQNGAITITKLEDGDVYIGGLIVNDINDMNLLTDIYIASGDYENGIILSGTYSFDVHVIKV